MKWFEKHKLIAYILTSTAVVTVTGLIVILPIAFTLTFHNPWILLFYFPIVGISAGINIYFEER